MLKHLAATVVDAVVRALHRHLAAEFHDAARRNVEELGRRLRVAVREVKHLPPEATEARVPAGHDRDPSDKKGRLHHVEVELSRAEVQHLRDVWLFHEAVAHPHRSIARRTLPEALASSMNFVT